MTRLLLLSLVFLFIIKLRFPGNKSIKNNIYTLRIVCVYTYIYLKRHGCLTHKESISPPVKLTSIIFLSNHSN